MCYNNAISFFRVKAGVIRVGAAEKRVKSRKNRVKAVGPTRKDSEGTGRG